VSFGSLSVALSSLFAQRRGMDVVGQNIANANTDGYSRQRVALTAMSGSTIPAIWATSGNGTSGVSVSDVTRLRDRFMEFRAQDTHARHEQLLTSRAALQRIEGVFSEPGDNGLQALMGEFWSGFDDVANRPGDLAAREQLLQRAMTVTDWLGRASSTLSAQWTESREQLVATAHEVNQAARSLADLNQAIMRATQAQVPSNDLQDQRDVLVLRLSQLVGATASHGQDGVIDVYVGGTALVRGSTSTAVQATGATGLAASLAGGATAGLEWSGGGGPVRSMGGRAGALTEALSTTITGYAGSLDGVARALISDVNAVHGLGYDLDGNTGTAFFTGTDAGTITVAITDGRRVAASSIPGASLDGRIADALAGLAVSTQPSSPSVLYRQLVVDIGVQSQTAQRRVATQAAVVRQVDDAREAQAGVSLDEEMTNLLAFQRAYEASARVLTAVDQALDILINRTGLAGR
jgi:flagellar hook-associated protein 1